MKSRLSALIFQQENHCTCTSELPSFKCASAGICTRTPNTMSASKPLHLFLNPFSHLWNLWNGMTRYFGAPSHQSLKFIDIFLTKHRQTNKDDGHNLLTNGYNKTRWVNAQQIDNLEIFTTLSKATGLQGKFLTWTTAKVHHPTTYKYAWMSCCVPSRHLPAPLSPQGHHPAPSHDEVWLPWRDHSWSHQAYPAWNTQSQLSHIAHI